ncbi:hypothetical protein Ddye_021911 [Dipteronia dyeriana]|uniref:Uncharacterized protein n=1 Tax=Dipteronia dyeriana TaxID=168575 RepID=A0AAD9U3A7_9ROSI|nr:hypothetical protein Ddye_021911 [Dipteronia dyeriana]
MELYPNPIQDRLGPMTPVPEAPPRYQPRQVKSEQVRDIIQTVREVQAEIREHVEKRKREQADMMQQIQIIHTISGGPIGTSNISRKNHERKVPHVDEGQGIFMVG